VQRYECAADVGHPRRFAILYLQRHNRLRFNYDSRLMPKIANLSTDRLRELALAGAEVTIRQLRAEIVALERALPELQLPAGRRALRRSIKQVQSRTRTMSAEARKAVSARMKRYWAERRKAQAKVK
jgi:hypothetical protein